MLHVCASGPAAAGCVCRWLAGLPRVGGLAGQPASQAVLPHPQFACYTNTCVCTQLRFSSKGAVVSAGFLFLWTHGVWVCAQRTRLDSPVGAPNWYIVYDSE